LDSLILYLCLMKKILVIVTLLFALLFTVPALAQCSICTKTAQQLGEKPGQGLNAGILYLAFTPLAIAGFIAYRWWKSQ
jgi:hypothetical protein